MSIGITKIEIIVGNQYSLWLPSEGIPLKIFLNEFNLLTKSPEDARPLYMTETFEISVEKNEDIIAAIKQGVTSCVLKINSVPLLTGFIQVYSENLSNIGTKTMSISVVSKFKSIVDFLGNNTLFLEIYNFLEDNFIVGDFTDSNSTPLMKFGQYLPIDKTTGYLEYNTSNVNDYCQPSICLVEYFNRILSQNGWTGNWDIFSTPINSKANVLIDKVCLVPTKNYLISSFGFHVPAQTFSIPAGESVLLPLTSANLLWNTNNGISNGCNPIGDGTVQILQPIRLMQFKLMGSYTSSLPFSWQITDGTETLLDYESIGNTAIRQYSDWVDPALEGLDPIFVQITNNNAVDIEVDIESMLFYNIFSAYETDQYDFLPPQTYYYPIADNYKDIAVLSLFRQFLILFQIAASINEQAEELDFYFLNNIILRFYDNINLNPYVLWDGYISLGSNLDGLANLNAVRYKGDTKKQYYFTLDLPNLPSNDVYFESIFLDTIDDKNWQAMVVPNGEYKVKNVDDIPVEYLNYKEIEMMIGYYTQISPGLAAMNFTNLSLGVVIREFWSNLIDYLSTTNGVNPSMYELETHAFIYEFLTNFRQRNFFQYLTGSILIGGEYNVMEEKFVGKYLSLQ